MKIITFEQHFTILMSYIRDILYIQTVHYVHSICMGNRLWPAAAVYGGIAVTGFKKYYGEQSRELAGLLVR